MKKKSNKRRNKNKKKKENKNQIIEIKNKVFGLILNLKINNPTENLFEYNNDKVTNINGFTEKNIFCCKNKINNGIYFKNNQIDIKEELKILFRVRKSKNNYYELIYPLIKDAYRDQKEIEKLDSRIWYVLKSENQNNKYENENEEYNLLENDIIKFGSTKYEIIEKHIHSSKPEIKNQINEVNHEFGSIFRYENKEDNTCEICHDNKTTEENPKVKLCKCDNYIHYKCIKNKLKQNAVIKINESKNVISYKCKGFICKKCECQYPYKFNINNKDYTLIDLKIPEQEDYIILENLSPIIEKKKNIKNIFVVNLTNKEITIGRNLNNDIIIDEDNNISRDHCLLKYDKENGYLTIVDKSAFGTSVLIKGNIKIELYKKLYLQIGNVFTKAEYNEKEVLEEDDKTTIDIDI